MLSEEQGELDGHDGVGKRLKEGSVVVKLLGDVETVEVGDLEEDTVEVADAEEEDVMEGVKEPPPQSMGIK